LTLRPVDKMNAVLSIDSLVRDSDNRLARIPAPRATLLAMVVILS
jgi:hypothetical protein